MDPEVWNQLSNHERSVLKRAYGENIPHDLNIEEARKFVKLVDKREGDPEDILHFE